MSKDTPRSGLPYIWPTLISGILSGDKKCRAAAWIKAHFDYVKKADDTFDSERWRREHDEMVDKRISGLQAAGHEVTKEKQNAFKLKGRVAIVGGTPDIIIHFDSGKKRIEDCKSGKRRGSDFWQVVVYGVVKGIIDTTLRGNINGGVVYKDGVVEITAAEIEEHRAAVIAEIQAIGGDARPEYVPSSFECAYCDIASCHKRVASKEAVHHTEEF
jgi:hypothetical protein